MISRRHFMFLAGTLPLAARLSWAADSVPQVLDHILLGCRDLDEGISFVEQKTGVRPQVGGVHPGRGTRNALLSLGNLHYLEVLTPDPQQKDADVKPNYMPRLMQLRTMTSPHLIGWAAHSMNIEALAAKLRTEGVAVKEVLPGARKRPNGQMLNWKSFDLADDHKGLLPFFIEWSKESTHPSVDAPGGCRVENFSIATPDTATLEPLVKQLGLDISVERASQAQLRATIAGPKGKFQVTS